MLMMATAQVSSRIASYGSMICCVLRDPEGIDEMWEHQVVACPKKREPEMDPLQYGSNCWSCARRDS